MSTGASTVKNDPNNFQVLLDVSHFLPDEIDVKTVDNEVVIQASHEERPDEHGVVKRQFSRRYLLPVGACPDQVTAILDSNGILAIRVPKEDAPGAKKEERIIPVVVNKDDADKDKENKGFKQSDV